jgi:deazaflavin-dependent oxidoreductase (nitroreductase family)
MIRLYARLIRRLGHHRWFSLLVKHALSKLDRSLILASRGRFSLSGREMGTMLLTTKGRRSGKERTTPVYYVHDGPKNLVAACENFGLEVASEWPKNLLADAHARIQIGATASEYRARLATDAEIARSMPRLVEMWPAHDTYLQRTGTRYVFVFQPVGASP